ncbi:MAG: signal peptidase I [Lachnospiraceae bacterium]|nr:signal peptidase I [Lachnospiraceae bacterium]
MAKNKKKHPNIKNQTTHSDLIPAPDELFGRSNKKFLVLTPLTKEEPFVASAKAPNYLIRKRIGIFAAATLFFLLSLFLLIPIFGINFYSMHSGSMERLLPVGSLIVTREVPANQLQKGDIITFISSDGTNITHKIIDVIQSEVNPEHITFRTQGVENPLMDEEPILPEQIQGKVFFHIPWVGQFITTLQNQFM